MYAINWRDISGTQIRLSAIVIRAPCSLDILELPVLLDVVVVVDSLREKSEQNSSNFSSSSNTGRLMRVRLCWRHLAEMGAVVGAVGGDKRGEICDWSAGSCDDDTIDIGFLSSSEWPDDFERDRDRFVANLRGKSSSPLRRLEWRFFSFFNVSSPLSSIFSAISDG